MNEKDCKRIACDVIDKAAGDLHEVSKEIWSHPELNFEEKHAHDVLTTFLEKYGFQVERHYKGMDTAFVATAGEGRPHVAVLCEYDALPEIGHACGHNLIAEVGAGAGIAIKEVLLRNSGMPGKVSVLGTPAEEGGGGKIDLIKRGAFEDFDICAMAHPSPLTLPDKSPQYLAITRCEVKFRGKASHAAGYPWEGLNALDAAVMAYSNVSCLRQQMKPTCRVHGVITNGGAKANIIPELTVMEYYVRGPTMGEVKALKERVIKCFEAAAIATGCSVEIEWDDRPYENMMGNRKLIELFRRNGEAVGVEFLKNPEKIYIPTGSTDMGNVSHVKPSIHPIFFIGEKVPNHSRGFTDVAGSDRAQPYTLQQAKALAMTALDVICQPELLQSIQKDFRDGLESEK